MMEKSEICVENFDGNFDKNIMTDGQMSTNLEFSCNQTYEYLVSLEKLKSIIPSSVWFLIER